MKTKVVFKSLSWLLSVLMIFSVVPCANVFAAETTEAGTLVTSRAEVASDIRIALFGDCHITVDPVWTTAERGIGDLMDIYKTIDANMDAFAMTGDIIFNVDPASEKTQDDTKKYQAVVDKMKEDFPNLDYSDANLSDTDNKNKAVWAMGNHEVTLGAYEGSVTKFDDGRTWQQEVADNVSKYKNFFGHDACYKTTVNGYSFVTAQPNDYLNNYVDPADKTKMSELETKAKKLLQEALDADNAKPVFYIQHEAVDKTCLSSSTSSPMRNSIEFRNFILDNPRIVTLSGHYHAPSNDPRLIWQSNNGSTHINVPASCGSTEKYGTTDEATAETDATRYHEAASQAMLMEVTGNTVTLRRFDIKTRKYIGEPITFTPGTANEAYTDARVEKAKTSNVNKPYFVSGAAITVSDVTNSAAKIEFPEAIKDGESAVGLQDSFVHYYTVTIKNKSTGGITETVKRLGDFWRSDDNKRSVRSVSFDNLSRNTEYEVSVTPSSSLGQEGTPLTVDFKTTNDKTAADLALTKKTNSINVAYGKTPVSSVSGASNLANLVDGKSDTMHAGTYNKDDYILLDLGRRYNVEKIVLNAYQSNSQGKTGFVLEASNDPDFSAAKTKKLYECAVNGSTNSDFDSDNNLTLTYSGSDDYRYIRYRRTADGYYIYIGDIQVYAREYITEVSRNKPVEANLSYYASNPASKAVNGESDGGWWSGYPGSSSGKQATFGTDEILDYLTVDLETAMPVDLIEIEYPKGISDNSASRQGWAVYGSNSLTDTAQSTGTNTVTYRPAMTATAMPDTFTELCSTGSGYYLPKYGTTPVKMYGNAYNAEGYVSQSVNTAGNAYRYITFKKLNKNIAQLGEVRAFVTSPTLNNVKKDGESVILSFSDAMDKTTLTSSNIKVYNTSGIVVGDAVISPSADGYEVVITGVADAQRVEMSYDIKSAKGVEVAGNMTRYIAQNVNLDGKPIISESNVNVAMGKNVTLSGITEESYSKGAAAVTDGSNSTIMYGSFAANADVTIDLENRYNIKRIVLTVPDGGNQTGQQYEIQLSNDENFEKYDVVHKVGGLLTITGGADVILDGNKDYRYVRYHKTSGAWAGISEIEVYADESLMEISRNATVTANTTWPGYSASAAVDGRNSSNADGWQSYYSGSDGQDYMWLNIDLGASYPIKKVEIESLYDGVGNGDIQSRRGWSIYGSNIAPVVADMQKVTKHTSGMNYLSADGYTQLAFTYGMLPNFNSGTGNNTKYTLAQCSTLLDQGTQDFNGIISQGVSGDYRYITLQRGVISLTGLGEVRVYTPAPVANSVTLDGNKVTLSFSDKMFPDTVNDETVVLTDSTGNVIKYTDAYADGYEYSFTVNSLEPGRQYNLTVSSTVKNLNSMPIAAKTLTFTTPAQITVSDVMITDASGTEVKGVLSANTSYNCKLTLNSILSDSVDAMIVIAQKDSFGNLVRADKKENVTVTANGTSNADVTFATDSAVGSMLEIYVWDSETLYPYSFKTTRE